MSFSPFVCLFFLHPTCPQDVARQYSPNPETPGTLAQQQRWEPEKQLHTIRHQAPKLCIRSSTSRPAKVPGDTSSIKKASIFEHLRASRSSKWSFRNTTAPHRWVCQAVGLAVEVDAWHRVPDPGSRNDHHTRPQVTPQVTPLARTVV